MASHSNETHVADYKKAKSKHSAKLHFLTFALSMILTVISFYIVGNIIAPSDGVAITSWSFAMPFITLLAIVQALFQLIFWMHMNEKGHLFPAIGIALGATVAATAIVAFVYWLGW